MPEQDTALLQADPKETKEQIAEKAEPEAEKNSDPIQSEEVKASFVALINEEQTRSLFEWIAETRKEIASMPDKDKGKVSFKLEKDLDKSHRASVHQIFKKHFAGVFTTVTEEDSVVVKLETGIGFGRGRGRGAGTKGDNKREWKRGTGRLANFHFPFRSFYCYALL